MPSSTAKSAFTLLVVLCACDRLTAQEAAPEPTEQHQLLAAEAGEWTGEMKVFMAGPDADPVVMPAKETNVMMDTGLWLISEFESGPFKGRGQFGYDPAKKKFVGTWIDNQTMALGIMEGTYDSKTGELTYLSEMLNPASGKMEPTKSVGKFVDKDTRQFVMYMQAPDGKGWNRWMEIHYRRAAK